MTIGDSIMTIGDYITTIGNNITTIWRQRCIHKSVIVNVSNSNIDFLDIDPDWSVKKHDSSNILTVNPDQLTSIVETDFKIVSPKILINTYLGRTTETQITKRVIGIHIVLFHHVSTWKIGVVWLTLTITTMF